MRHRIKTDRFGRFSSYRKASLKSIAASILTHERIITTKAKAKSARRLVEKVITLGKKGTLSAKRRAFSILCDHELVKTLFDNIAPKFANIMGGYTRIIPYRFQRGDNAQLVIFELTQRYKEGRPEKKIKEKKEAKPAAAKKQELPVTKEAKPPKVKIETEEKKEVIEGKPKTADLKEKKEPLKKEQLHAHLEEEKQKKPEIKKPKKFFGGFKGLFKRERDSL